MSWDLNQFKNDSNHQTDLNKTSIKEQLTVTEEEIKEEWIPRNIEKLRDLQVKLFAEEKRGILVVLQGMDASGKDEGITFIFSQLSAQGLRENAFKKPDTQDLKHDFLWRFHPGLPERGEIAIFNRSYYEQVVSTRVHETLEDEQLPDDLVDDQFWERRYRQINDFERHLVENGFPVVKFFMNVSKDVQKGRLLERMENPEQNWDFSFSDVEDRDKWEDFYSAFDDMLKHTSTDYAPWYVLPADDEWLTRYLVSEVMIQVLEDIDPKKPVISGEDQEKLDEYIEKLKNE